MDIPGLKAYVIRRFSSELNPRLYYHNLDHTLDVYNAASHLSLLEGIDEYQRVCLEAAALLHDSGMLKTYFNHEDISAEIAREVLGDFGFTPADITLVSDLILVTKLPQRPYNILEQIICDADLDYLGRPDYLIYAFKLRLEWQIFNIKNTTLPEWFNIQRNFLTDHNYFTKAAQKERAEKKQQNLDEVLQLMNYKL